MFTGIVTDIGSIASVQHQAGDDLRLAIACGYDLQDVAIGASIACSGVCLTVTGIEGDRFLVDVSAETVARTARDMWQAGARLNLERALKVGDELGGHIVTGHVDGVGVVEAVQPVDGSLRFAISAPPILAGALAPKGSITVDGVSLTLNSVEDRADDCLFTLNVIPHTAKWTTLGDVVPGRIVNLEIDVLARYLQRMMAVRREAATS